MDIISILKYFREYYQQKFHPAMKKINFCAKQINACTSFSKADTISILEVKEQT